MGYKPETYRRYFLKNKKKIYARQKRWRKENKNRVKNYGKRWRGLNPNYNKTWSKKDRKKNPEKHRRYGQDKNRKLKIKVMFKYGGECVACRCTELVLLTIDHVNDDGAKDRKDGLYGHNLYSYLNKRKRQNKFQILCWACQQRKRFYGSDFSKWESQMTFLDKLS